VLVHGNRKFAFLHRDDFLLLLGRPIALFLLVKEAPVVLNAADRRNRVRRYLDQVESPFARDSQCLKWRQNAKLFAVFVDDADFARTNLFIDANKGFSRTFIECDGAPPRVAAAPLADFFRSRRGTTSAQ
jgi:hypothetical protein